MASQAIKSREPILGYEVTDRIGAGGYGEVWRATAPGGLTKAIKFVYGFLDDERAKRELKALSRVKQVRHPFLLSLERIEVVDGQLVIITELADMSLKDRHEQCKAAGMVGIPRDELLGYLHDAADALDYMRERYSLQHLDVKPENLLLVGNHVKVADFGLVKDIDDTRASMMGGLTPIYAPPEVFDDRPSQCSDQYSLAIVYQELLTDTLPFPGKTTAQLAAQHLQSKARLTALPPNDKPIIERALAKAPTDRFPDCRTMVQMLIAAGRANVAPQPGAATPAGSGDTTPLAVNETHQARPLPTPANHAPPTNRTQTFDECRTQREAAPESQRAPESAAQYPAQSAVYQTVQAAAPATATAPAPPPRVRPTPTVTDLPPLAASTEPYLRPALFLAVGGTATAVLTQLRRKLEDRFGSLDHVPALQLLAVDTDAELLTHTTPRDGEIALAERETLVLPLRKSDDYRAGSNRLLAWMSRRWLYNIPRSLQTEGLRPLGRLAFVDHFATLAARLDGSLDTIITAAQEAIAAAQASTPADEQSSESSPLPWRDAVPRIVLLTSISGGTGGGMSLDVAYLLKQRLAERGLPADALQVVLLHSTGRNPAAHDLAVANAYATLSELAHYAERGYPGEPGCGLQPLPAAEAKLNNAYLVHLGDEIGEQELSKSAAAVANYLFLAATTAASNWFAAALHSDTTPAASEGEQPETELRTFGICQLGCDRDVVTTATDQLCRALLERWCGERQTRRQETPADGASGLGWSNAEIDRLALERTVGMAITVDDVVIGLQQAVEVDLGRDVKNYLTAEVARLQAQQLDTQMVVENDIERPAILVALDRLVATPKDDEAGPLAASQETHIKNAVRLQAASVRAWAMELTEEPGARVKGAIRAVEGIARQVRTLRDEAQSTRTRTVEELRITALAARAKPKTRVWPGLGGNGNAAAELTTRLVQYGMLKFLESLLQSAAKFAQSLTWELSNIVDQLKDAQRELTHIAAEFTPAEATSHRTAPKETDTASAIAAGIRDALQAELPELAAHLDTTYQAEFTRRYGGLCAGLAQGPAVRAGWVRELRTAARAAILDVVRQAAIGRRVLEQDNTGAGDHELLRSCLQEATPTLMPCGGARRLLIVTPNEPDSTALATVVHEVTGHAPSIFVDPKSEPVLCYEVAALPLWSAAASMVADHPHCAQLAARLHTRCDLTWTVLTANVR